MRSHGVAGVFTVLTIAGIALLLQLALIALRARRFPPARSWCALGTVGFAVCLLAYGLLGDWGGVTTRTLDPKSARWAGLVWAGTGTLLFALIAIVATCAMLIRGLARRGHA
jgi:hypothetical protein